MKKLGLLICISILPPLSVEAQINGKRQLSQVHRTSINDPFWNPRFELWEKSTANDVLDKFEGKHLKSSEEQQKNNVFANFDKIAAGKKGKGGHAGLPWFDGLVYESIRGIGDLLGKYPDVALQARVDGYIDRIYAAQQADTNDYLNTYTDLMEPDHHWGDNGGFLRWQHDVYNAGMLVEAGVHYYKATGKIKLLEVATRYANYMSGLMGAPPKRNIVPAHSGPEEALVKLYWLFKENPELKKKLGVPVDEQAYFNLAKFWIENRGHNAGYPLWLTWGNDKSERWIKDQKYKDGRTTASARPAWGDYAQDSIPVFEQKTIEGHAVRATLLATGIAAAALENHEPAYMMTADRLWDNMAGRRMFVTGGVGAIHNDEKFGADYFLPTNAYLETCAAVGAGFFSQRMNELTGDGKYMDEFERVLYNNVLTGVSLSGTKYTYQNPLNSHDHARWEWHSCPCCPPMFLKMVSALPDYIYASADNRLYVNMFIGSNADVELNGNLVAILQETGYPWNGKISLKISPEKPASFAVHVRIPGWARGIENPYGLYQSDLKDPFNIRINGVIQQLTVENGYVAINRIWRKGDKVDLELPMKPRMITANEKVKDLKNMVALASGPLIYCLEGVDNANLENLQLDAKTALGLEFRKNLLSGVNLITGTSTTDGKELGFMAIPYYAAGNREGKGYKVWLQKTAHININTKKILNRISPLTYGSNIEDVNHEIYGGFYDQRIFGESFEEPATGVNLDKWRRFSGFWTAKDSIVTIIPGRNTTSNVVMHGVHPLGVEADQSAKLVYQPKEFSDGAFQVDMRFVGKGESGAFLLRVNNAGIGNDVFDGYEISLNRDGKKLMLGKHMQDFKLLKEETVNFNPESWNTIKVALNGPEIIVFLNGNRVLSYRDDDAPLLKGKIGLRTWKSGLEFRNVVAEVDGKTKSLTLNVPENERVSYNWDAIQGKEVTATFAVDSTTAYNGKQSQLIIFAGGAGKAGITNGGLNRWGIAVREKQVFQGRLYLKGQKLKGSAYVALESADGTKTYAVEKLNGIGAEWKKFPFTLTSNATDKNARLAVYITSKGKLWVDQVVLTGTGEDQFRGLPIRADIGKMLVKQGLTFLRYAGTMVNSPEYRFKKMIGDPDKRPPYRGHWNRYSSNGFGIEEFLQFCEATSIASCFTINIYETPQDMADMVEYFNGEVTTKWGAVRAKNGHPKPYGAKYIEIGNEEVLFNGDKKEAYEEYVARFNLIYDAMKQKDSTLKIIHSAWWRPNSMHMEYVFKQLNGKADFWDLHVGGDDPKAGLETDKQITKMLGLMRQWDPATKMKIAVFEENGSKHGMQRALGHATNLNAIRRHSEDVLTSSPANALQPYLQNDNDWDQGQIFFTPDQVWGMPPFYAQKMQAENHLPVLVESQVEGNLDVTAASSEDGKTLILHVVNTEADLVNTVINMAGFEDCKPEAEIYSMSGDLNAQNTPAYPDQFKPKPSKITLAGQELSYDFPAHSYTIMKFSR
jgi:DUF1680 family protein/alpha-L-arabinofuranosidase